MPRGGFLSALKCCQDENSSALGTGGRDAADPQMSEAAKKPQNFQLPLQSQELQKKVGVNNPEGLECSGSWLLKHILCPTAALAHPSLQVGTLPGAWIEVRGTEQPQEGEVTADPAATGTDGQQEHKYTENTP